MTGQEKFYKLFEIRECRRGALWFQRVHGPGVFRCLGSCKLISGFSLQLNSYYA
jgi:hypothetical protein